ncbi:uncharacterized protein EI97DRAFT_419217 [Westerdykella ornata]|uniref:Uncharacterized protein n=1 Tax=Westerdykella ornata TaxID=318751 RepID=A0A6A6JJE7_WESOR|nr:uncharacterized protein EI97DRAFT_419217 [Westerdykella ornata]KAF2276263.1 hypothetical protein EI97DRAFT_419217 [Westerdykella ornata]
MTDADGDSTMHNPADLASSDTSKFPTLNESQDAPSTPQNPFLARVDPSSELSPPDSQEPSQRSHGQAFPFGAPESPAVKNENGKRIYAPSSGSAAPRYDKVQTDPETGYQWMRAEDQPGWEWMNSRAREEAARAWEQIVDKDLMIRGRYGDPLDPSIEASAGSQQTFGRQHQQ